MISLAEVFVWVASLFHFETDPNWGLGLKTTTILVPSKNISIDSELNTLHKDCFIWKIIWRVWQGRIDFFTLKVSPRRSKYILGYTIHYKILEYLFLIQFNVLRLARGQATEVNRWMKRMTFQLLVNFTHIFRSSGSIKMILVRDGPRPDLSTLLANGKQEAKPPLT